MALALYLVETGQREDGRFRRGAVKEAVADGPENRGYLQDLVAQAGYALRLQSCDYP